MSFKDFIFYLSKKSCKISELTNKQLNNETYTHLNYLLSNLVDQTR